MSHLIRQGRSCKCETDRHTRSTALSLGTVAEVDFVPITRDQPLMAGPGPTNLHNLLLRHWPALQPPVLVCHSSLDTKDGKGKGAATSGWVT